jgi:rubredoxin
MSSSDDEVEKWACGVCKLEIAVRADGLARTQHLAGKKHKKKMAAAEREGNGGEGGKGAGGADGKAKKEIDTSKWWECDVCGYSLAFANKVAHLNGAAHRGAETRRSQFKEKYQPGDWLCRVRGKWGRE